MKSAVDLRAELAWHGRNTARARRAAQTLVDGVREGLARQPLRELPCKYFYDDRGSALFDAITRLPEYYPKKPCSRPTPLPLSPPSRRASWSSWAPGRGARCASSSTPCAAGAGSSACRCSRSARADCAPPSRRYRPIIRVMSVDL